jgi:tRNA A-37 threonylcarbamoyl transferase component Bud32
VSPAKAGSFELRELLGEGGVGQVYSARDPVLGRQVAVKMLRRELSEEREFRDRFYGEAQRLGDLNHPNITTLYGLYFEDDKPFMVMELVRGRTLKELREHVRRLPPRESLAVLAQTLAGLAYAHRAGVIHRDIKPSNLMITEGGIVKIMDFGIARVRGSTHMTRAGQALLTPLYASPEQIRGEEVDERSDLYSLGIVFYEMLAGRPPFTARSEYLLEKAHLEDPPPPLAAQVPGLDPAVAAAVMRALAKDPEDRFAGAEEFGRAVDARAIRGDAPEILQEFIAAAFRETPPDETRQLRRTIAPPVQPSLPPAPPAAGATRAAASLPAVSLFRSRSKAPVPAAILGGIALALAVGIGYAGLRSWGPPAFHWLPAPGPIAAVTPPKSAAPPSIKPPAAGPHVASVEPPAIKPPAKAAPSAPRPQGAMPRSIKPPAAGPHVASVEPPAIKPPARAAPPAPRPQGAMPPSIKPPAAGPHVASVEPPAIKPPAKAAPSAPPAIKKPAAALRTASAEPPPAPSSLPRSKPDLAGVVKGAMSASTIKVGGRWIELYGIRDHSAQGSRRHIEAMARYLAPAQGRVECYRKALRTYQCYSGGKDLALLALRDGIAQPARDAPPEYREAALHRPPSRKRP